MVIFDDAEPAGLVVPCGPAQDREQLKQKIGMIEERGGTHMSTGMRLGLAELKRGQRPGYVSSMLLLTDGQTWEDQQTCRDLADQSRAAGIPIYAMGLGIGGENNWDPRLLEDLAQRSGGEWLVIEIAGPGLCCFREDIKSWLEYGDDQCPPDHSVGARRCTPLSLEGESLDQPFGPSRISTA